MNKAYKRYLKSPKWKRKRKLIFKLKGKLCRKCGRRANQIAHKNYKRIYRDSREDLNPSCPYCNREEYKKRTA